MYMTAVFGAVPLKKSFANRATAEMRQKLLL